MTHIFKVLKNEGDETPGLIPGDLIFVINQSSHPVFTRRDNDLYMQETITLMEALTGFDLPITTIDGRHLLIHVDEIIQPGEIKTLLNEGMPIAHQQQQQQHVNSIARGSLLVQFKVQFPAHLNMELKNYVRLLLDPKFNEEAMNSELQKALQELKQQAAKLNGKHLASGSAKRKVDGINVRLYNYCLLFACNN